MAHPEIEPADELEGSVAPLRPHRPDLPGLRAARAAAVPRARRAGGRGATCAALEDPLPEALRERLGAAGRSREALRAHPLPAGGRRSGGARPAPEPGAPAAGVRRAVLPAARPGAQAAGGEDEPGIAFDVSGDAAGAGARGLLPFTLTGAQARAVAEIGRDMARPEPMNRLLQGDVGSGKTAVALVAAALALEDGYQVALMAPTEILAEQHHAHVRAAARAARASRWRWSPAAARPKRKREAREAVARGRAPHRGRHARAHPGGRRVRAAGPGGRSTSSTASACCSGTR